MNSGVLKAYECSLAGYDGPGSVRYAESAGKARYAFLLDIRDCCPDTTFTEVRVRSLGPVAGQHDSDLDRLAASYGLPPLPLGTPAEFEGRPCEVAGYREGYITLRFPDGERITDHILSKKRYFLADGTVIDGEEAARAYDARWQTARSE